MRSQPAPAKPKNYRAVIRTAGPPSSPRRPLGVTDHPRLARTSQRDTPDSTTRPPPNPDRSTLIDNPASRLSGLQPNARIGVSDARAYIDGINAHITGLLAHPADLPGEYPLLQKLPSRWVPEDLVAIASLVGGIFGRGGGGEVANVCGLAELSVSLGDKVEARRVFDDLHFADDAESPTTARQPFPYLGDGAPDPAAHPTIDCASLRPIDSGSPACPICSMPPVG